MNDTNPSATADMIRGLVADAERDIEDADRSVARLTEAALDAVRGAAHAVVIVVDLEIARVRRAEAARRLSLLRELRAAARQDGLVPAIRNGKAVPL